jgi:hypothetical protein
MSPPETTKPFPLYKRRLSAEEVTILSRNFLFDLETGPEFSAFSVISLKYSCGASAR